MGGALLALAAGLLLFYIFIPSGAGAEYAYTVRQAFKSAFLPLLAAAAWALWPAFLMARESPPPWAARLAAGFSSGRARLIAFIKNHKYSAAAVFLSLAALFCAAFSWKYSFSFFLGLLISLLPYACLAGLVWLFRLKSQDKPLFLAVIQGSLFWSSAVWLLTNALSWLGMLSGGIIARFWLAFFIPLAWLLFKKRSEWRPPPIHGWAWVPAIIAFFTLISGIAYPPNNYDVLTYHMPRVLHWLQNGSLAAYAASVDRQIGMAPFNALAAMQSYAPARLDYFVSLGQWLAYAGCMIGVCQISAELGLGKKARAAALIFSATLPTAISQASNVESSLLVAFFLCAMAWLFLLWMKEKEPSLRLAALFGLSLGFAILSKGSAYVIAFPFVLIIAWRCASRPKSALIPGLAAAILVIGVNAPHLIRTYAGEGSIVKGGEKNILAKPSPRAFLNNAVYNFAVNNPVLLKFGGTDALIKLSEAMGIQQDDPVIFPFGGIENTSPPSTMLADATMPNTLQSIFLIFVAIAAALGRFRPPPLYSCAVLASFILFNLALTWHAWIPRIQMPLFLLASPLCGLCAASFKSPRAERAVLAAFCAFSFFPLFMSVERPLLYRSGHPELPGHFLAVPRDELMLNVWPKFSKDYAGAVYYIASKHPEKIGVKIGTNGFEYPLWQILRERLNDKAPEIVSILPGQKDMPEYVFDWERMDQEDVKYPPRVLKYENGAAEAVYGGSSAPN